MTEITKEMIEAAKAAYWHEMHHGGGYTDKCYEAAIRAALSTPAAASDVEATASSHPVSKQGLPLLQKKGRTETVAGTDHPNFHESAKLSKSCHENTSKSAAPQPNTNTVDAEGSE